MRNNNQRWSGSAREQSRKMSHTSRARSDSDDEPIANNRAYREAQPRQRFSREYNRRDHYEYGSPRRFNLAWVIVPLLLVATAALGFGAYNLVAKPALAQIVAVTPNYTTIKKPYKSCHKEATTSYVANQKNGTNGALIGGATGALAGREIQRSNQPDYVAKQGSTTKCATLYKSVRVKSGTYTVQYNYKDNFAKVVTNSAPAIGTTMPIAQLQALAAN